ncbi:MAG TPA: hypothetical protein VL357_03865 [Rariglobus sp.]|jgi:hypothetical protein|nr:hypothetical protein [Rariglobus sp.]
MSFPRRSTLVTLCVATLLALHCWLGVGAVLEKSVTADETAHLAGGYSYWRLNDYRLQPENGNLPQRWAGIPLLLQQPRLEPADHPAWWSTSNVWLISSAFFFESGNNTDFMLATARAMMMFWSVATGFLVFVWSRRLWGNAGGLLSLALYAFSATTLAHGPLVTSDMTVTFFLLAAVGAYWRHLERPGMMSFGLSCVVTGLAAVAKFSFLLLIPAYALLIAWRLVESAPLIITCGRHIYQAETRLARTGCILASTAVHIAIAWLFIWMAFGFRFDAAGSGQPSITQYYMPWQIVMPTHGFWKAVVGTARTWHLLPDAYLQGFSYVLYAAQERSGFLNGAYSNTGWFLFFPYTFFAKTPPAELLATILALGTALVHWRGKSGARIFAGLRFVAPLLALSGVYWAFSLTSHLNIGHRHILPVYPPLFILCGLLVRPAVTRMQKWGATMIAVLAAATAFSTYPNYLAYFNLLSGGSSQGYHHLIDSSLDWGQDLPGLKTWLDTNRKPEEPVYLAYFGMGSPRYEGIKAAPLSPYYYHYQPRHWFELKPGLYCISATLIQDAYSPWRGDWTGEREYTYQTMLKRLRREIAEGKRSTTIAEFGEGDSHPLWALDRLRFARLTSYLRLRRPDAMIGYSILVYRLTAEEVHTSVDGSITSLADMMEHALNPQKP